MKSIVLVHDVQHICICQMKQFLGNSGDRLFSRSVNRVVPLHDAALHLPLIEINLISRVDEGKLPPDTAQILPLLVQFKLRKQRQHFFLHHTEFPAAGIKNLQAVPP